MSGTYASRWASPEPSEPRQEGDDMQERQGAVGPEAAATDPGEVDEGVASGSAQLAGDIEGMATLHASAEGPLEVDKSEATDDWHPVPRRLKTRVNWNGRWCIISIPRPDKTTGNLDSMASREIPEHLEESERTVDDRQDTRVQHSEDKVSIQAHVKPVYPDEIDTRRDASQEAPRVSLPNLAKWAVYMDELTERRLAALGVSAGLGGTHIVSGAQDMSRQNSTQYPPLPLSPPFRTISAGSIGRPDVHGHLRTMSVISPHLHGDGPFRHIHRHSTFAGPLPSDQHPAQHHLTSPVPNMQRFSPRQQFDISGLHRDAMLSASASLRPDLSLSPGLGSPLGQQWTPQSHSDYRRNLMDDQRTRQHAQSQLLGFNSVSNISGLQDSDALQLANLPALPEEDTEGELLEVEHQRDLKSKPPMPSIQQSEPPAYLPPHKRAPVTAEIVSPMPRSHSHNISEDLEFEIFGSEARHRANRDDWIEVVEEACDNTALDKSPRSALSERDHRWESLADDDSERKTMHGHRKGASRFNVAAPAFTPGLSASTKPPSATFVFGIGVPKADLLSLQDNSCTGSSTCTAASTANSARSAFSFSTQVPPFQPNVMPFEPRRPLGRTVVDDLPSIFGEIQIPHIIKPSRRSKAIAIVRPNERPAVESGTEHEDENGRIAQSDDRLKRQRKLDSDGDGVPQFVMPFPMPDPLDSNDTSLVERTVTRNKVPAENSPVFDGVGDTAEPITSGSPPDAQPYEPVVGSWKRTPSKMLSDVRSGRWRPLPSATKVSVSPYGTSESEVESKKPAYYSDLDEGEILCSLPIAANDSDSERAQLAFKRANLPASGLLAHPRSSFDEIDTVMRQLNHDEPESEPYLDKPSTGAHSPLLRGNGQTMDGVTYLPKWSRSDAPSPSPTHGKVHRNVLADSSITVHEHSGSDEARSNSWSQVRRLNKRDDAMVSDWSDMLSSPEQKRLVQRSKFFDSHIDEVIGRVVENRLLPLERSLREIQHVVSRRPTSKAQSMIKRSSSVVGSDADDEEELVEARLERPISSGRDKRFEQIKAVVLEALHEQASKWSQPSNDISGLHSSITDMKMAVDRISSAGTLDIDSVRVAVEEALSKHHPTVESTVHHDIHNHHKREVSELEGKLHETLAGALEEANYRRAVEERDAETRRLLRLAEEELTLLRETTRDEQSRLRAVEAERNELLNRIETAEEQLKGLEAENAAMQGTLAEYRMSSDKWRQAIDDGHHERKELEGTIAVLERQAEDSQESGNAIRRRLEKLQADMALAAGQFTSEQSKWKAKEEKYRARLDDLNSLDVHASTEKATLTGVGMKLRTSPADSIEPDLERDCHQLENAPHHELLRQLKADLIEQQQVITDQAKRYLDAQDAERAQWQLIRLSLESEIREAKHQVDNVRFESENELVKVRTELDCASQKAEAAKALHKRKIEDQETASRDAICNAKSTHSIALDEAHQTYEARIKHLTSEHRRALQFAVEDKERLQSFSAERMALSDAKLQHAQDRIAHLGERLEIAKSIAHAAASKAMTSPPSASTAVATLPAKASPQVLRESILVLQEQLQERESRLERFQDEVDHAGTAKIKERDVEIAWLRELLGVRSEELDDLINSLSQPDVDHHALRDIAIRIRANLQMEQQEKERFDPSTSSLSGQALASLSSFATPKAAQLTHVFSKWRANMESSALRNASQSAAITISSTPSRTRPSTEPRRYAQGLMTPPASDLRATPSLAEPASMPTSRLLSRDAKKTDVETRNTAASPTTPLFREQSYDRDAQDHTDSIDDDNDLDVAGAEPPALRVFEMEPDISAGAEAPPDRT